MNKNTRLTFLLMIAVVLTAFVGCNEPQGDYPSGLTFSYKEGDNRISLSTSKTATAEIGNNKATINRYNKLISADKNNADLYIKRGIAYTLDRYYKTAIRDFDKAIQLDPQNTSAYYNRAIAYAGKDDGFDAAIADLIIVLENNREDNDVWYAIGVLYYRQYEKDKTVASLDMAIDIFEHIPNYKDTNDIVEYLYGLK